MLNHAWVWPVLFAIGCYHGINPGMGWLFAVALGLQEKSSRAVFGALPPIALGHVASVAALVLIAGVAELSIPYAAVRFGAAALLFLFGLVRIVRARHLRWVGMRVGSAGLALWAFVMATGHGAGLMLLPFLTGSLGHTTPDARMHAMGHMTGIPPLPVSLWVWAVVAHTGGYLFAMTMSAWLVYERFGMRILRTAWFNFDLIWAVALVVSAALIIVL